MTKLSRHPVTVYRPADRLGDDQPDLWQIACGGMDLAVGVHNEVGLCGPDATTHGEAEVG
jgi:hypothetical protein